MVVAGAPWTRTRFGEHAARHRGAQRPLCARGHACASACCIGRGRAHSAWHARVCALKASYDCGVPRTDVCPHSHGRQKGQCNKLCQHHHVRPSRRRAEVRRRTASQRHMCHWPMGHGPWLAVGKKVCGKLRTTNTRRRAHAHMCVLFCVAVLCVSVFVARLCVCLCLFVRSCVCLCVCLLFHVCFRFLHASACVRLCI